MGRLKALLDKLSPRQRQWALLAALLGGGFGLLYLVLLLSSGNGSTGLQPPNASSAGLTPTNIGVMAPGQQVNPVDQWVGTAGRKLEKYEAEREQQAKLNKEHEAFQASVMKRFAEIEQRVSDAARSAAAPSQTSAITVPPVAPTPSPTPSASSLPTTTPALPPPLRPTNGTTMPPGVPPFPAPAADAAPALVRVSLVDPSRAAAAKSATAAAKSGDGDSQPNTVDTYLPVSFTRGVLLGGLDAPTGGQAQSNPHPVLIRLSDASVLPNRFRGEYRECFVIAAGYGDISSERAYLRTENLSCIRHDGSTLEVRIQGSVYGEDGKVGMRGRLVTKQGQMLANALLAGIVGGIGQGIASYNTTTSTSVFGTVATTSGADALRAGIGSGVGKALDRLAQYYIRLAEQTFPVIEVDAGREIDVVITKGVRIEPETKIRPASVRAAGPAEGRIARMADDEAE